MDFKTWRKSHHRTFSRLVILQAWDLCTSHVLRGVYFEPGPHRCGQIYSNRIPAESFAYNWKDADNFILRALCWCLPAAFLVPYLIHSEIVQSDEHTFCRNMMGPNKLEIYSFLGFVVFYCVPLVLIIVLYSRIVKYLQRRKEKPDGEIRGEGSNRLRIRQNQNTSKIFGSIVLGFFACWTPLYIYMFLKSLNPSILEKDKCLLLKLVGVLYYIFPVLSTAINPFILITFSSSFRTAVKSECFRFLSWKNHSHQFARVRVVSPQEPSILLLEFTNLSKKIT